MKRCYVTNCPCGPGAPRVGTKEYGVGRAHPDAGDLEALAVLSGWLLDSAPLCHPRYADGELHSATGLCKGVNTDGLEFHGDTLGVMLASSLDYFAESWRLDPLQHLLVGGDWTAREHAQFIAERGHDRSIPWCPSGIFVNGIEGGEILDFLRALSTRTNKFLVSNPTVAPVCKALGFESVLVHPKKAWDDFGIVMSLLSGTPPNSTILYCAGMVSEALIYSLRLRRPDLSHIDLGHLFDGAFGIRNRTWMLGAEHPRWTAYKEKFAPIFRGEKKL